MFHPRGLLGQLYWWGISPFHGLVFGTMVRNVVRAAERRAATVSAAPGGRGSSGPSRTYGRIGGNASDVHPASSPRGEEPR